MSTEEQIKKAGEFFLNEVGSKGVVIKVVDVVSSIQELVFQTNSLDEVTKKQ